MKVQLPCSKAGQTPRCHLPYRAHFWIRLQLLFTGLPDILPHMTSSSSHPLLLLPDYFSWNFFHNQSFAQESSSWGLILGAPVKDTWVSIPFQGPKGSWVNLICVTSSTMLTCTYIGISHLNWSFCPLYLELLASIQCALNSSPLHFSPEVTVQRASWNNFRRIVF